MKLLQRFCTWCAGLMYEIFKLHVHQNEVVMIKCMLEYIQYINADPAF